jgi:hypothetical protein
MDYLVVGCCLLRREAQPQDHPLLAARRQFAPD